MEQGIARTEISWYAVFEAVTTFHFVFDDLSAKTFKRKVQCVSLGLNGANHRNRFLNYSLFCWKFGVIEAPVGKEKRCDSHYLQSIRSICIVLSHKSTYFMTGEVSICTDKPCVTKTHARYELYCPKTIFLRDSSGFCNDRFYLEIVLFSVYRSTRHKTRNFDLRSSQESDFLFFPLIIFFERSMRTISRLCNHIWLHFLGLDLRCPHWLLRLSWKACRSSLNAHLSDLSNKRNQRF